MLMTFPFKKKTASSLIQKMANQLGLLVFFYTTCVAMATLLTLTPKLRICICCSL